MRLIVKPRQSGKTSELIRMSEETNAYILTLNRGMAEYVSKMAEQQGYNILFPITLDEYMRSRLKGSHVTHILIDNADMILQHIFSEATIDAITMSEQEPTVKAVPNWIPITYRSMTDEEKKHFSEYTGYDVEDFDTMLDCPLPEDGETVLITDRLGNVEVDTFNEGCYFECNCDIEDVIAWMPLPEAYKGSDEE